MIKRIYVALSIVLVVVISPKVLALDVYRCIGSDGVVVFTAEPLKAYEIKDCKKVVLNPDGWNSMAIYGNKGDSDQAFWYYRFFDTTRPASKLWVKIVYMVPEPIVNNIILFNIKCTTKQISLFQSATEYSNGKNILSDAPGVLRYAIPGTSDEEILKIACKSSQK